MLYKVRSPLKYHKWQTLFIPQTYAKNTGHFQHLGAPLSGLGLVGSICQLQVCSMAWRGEVPSLPDTRDIPKSSFFFFMGAEKIAFSQSFYWQYHRITECFGLERILKMIQGLTVVGGIPSFQGTLSRIISIFYEPQSCSSTAGVFYFLLLYLFSFTS